jgi:signal peptidase I
MDARPSAPRRLAGALVLGACGLILCRAFVIEPYEVPTGSMAPAIAGRHRAAVCPRCGCRFLVGRNPAENTDGVRPAWYARARCPNCGCDRLGLDEAAEAAGDQVLVNKSAFLFRRPRRWEVIVFRLFGKTFIKRLVGLAGEVLEILDGDIYIDGRLARKTLDEARAMRILVFDNDCTPGSDDWRPRWETPAGHSGPHPLVGTELHLDGTGGPGACPLVTYRHYLPDRKQCQPVCDEYSYNGPERRAPLPVHDFFLGCDVEVREGEGHVVLGLTDGRDAVLAEVPAGGGGPRPVVLRAPSSAEASAAGLPPPPAPGVIFALGPAEPLRPGRAYHVELAFVDRRVSLAVDGRAPLPAVDLPPSANRPGVDRPASLGARGVRVVVRGFRLYRDVHYTQAGRNAVAGKAVHLGTGQYFVLGDNSPSSDDSRFWPGGGAVPAGCVVGKPFLVHLPTRIATWQFLGRTWQSRLPDWGRVRWLR